MRNIFFPCPFIPLLCPHLFFIASCIPSSSLLLYIQNFFHFLDPPKHVLALPTFRVQRGYLQPATAPASTPYREPKSGCLQRSSVYGHLQSLGLSCRRSQSGTLHIPHSYSVSYSNTQIKIQQLSLPTSQAFS